MSSLSEKVFLSKKRHHEEQEHQDNSPTPKKRLKEDNETKKEDEKKYKEDEDEGEQLPKEIQNILETEDENPFLTKKDELEELQEEKKEKLQDLEKKYKDQKSLIEKDLASKEEKLKKEVITLSTKKNLKHAQLLSVAKLIKDLLEEIDDAIYISFSTIMGGDPKYAKSWVDAEKDLTGKNAHQYPDPLTLLAKYCTIKQVEVKLRVKTLSFQGCRLSSLEEATWEWDDDDYDAKEVWEDEENEWLQLPSLEKSQNSRIKNKEIRGDVKDGFSATGHLEFAIHQVKLAKNFT